MNAPDVVTMAEAPVLADERVMLTPFLPEHVGKAYVGWLNDAEVMRYTEARFAPHTLATAHAYVAENLASDSAYLWRILGVEGAEGAEGTHVGNLRLGNIDRHHRRGTIALIIGAADARGQGIGSRAIELAAAYGLNQLGLEKIYAGMYANNTPSICAFAKAGFEPEARLRGHHIYQGARIDGVIMARFKPGCVIPGMPAEGCA